MYLLTQRRSFTCKCKLKQDTKTDDIAIIVPLVHLRDDIPRLVDEGMRGQGGIKVDVQIVSKPEKF
jgi:hypothetical protein